MKPDLFLQKTTHPKMMDHENCRKLTIPFLEILISILVGILAVIIILILFENLALAIEPRSLYFGKEINISKNVGTSELPQVTAEGTNVYVVWQDNSTGNNDIYFAHSVDTVSYTHLTLPTSDLV